MTTLAVLRPEVAEFASYMELALQRKDATLGPRGWVERDPRLAFAKLKATVEQFNQPMTNEQRRTLLADIANWAMIILDQFGGLALHEERYELRHPGERPPESLQEIERTLVDLGHALAQENQEHAR
jgi:hypothetical protein